MKDFVVPTCQALYGPKDIDSAAKSSKRREEIQHSKGKIQKAAQPQVFSLRIDFNADAVRCWFVSDILCTLKTCCYGPCRMIVRPAECDPPLQDVCGTAISLAILII